MCGPMKVKGTKSLENITRLPLTLSGSEDVFHRVTEISSWVEGALFENFLIC